MTFRDAAVYSMIEFNSIYSSFGQYLDHCFTVCGNGLEWSEEGLEESSGRAEAVAMLERTAAKGGINITRKVPRSLRYSLRLHDIPANIEARMNDPLLISCYGFSEYSRIGKIPDNVPADWLNAAITHLVIVMNTPPEHFMRVRMAEGECRGKPKKEAAKLRKGALKEYTDTQKTCTTILANLRKRFPNHVWTNPIGTFKLDPKRKDPAGVKYWSLDEKPVSNLDELIHPFIYALEFAYTVTPKPGVPHKKLKQIFDKLAATAIKLGQICLNDKLECERLLLEIEGKKQSLLTVLDSYPKSTGPMQYRFDETLRPIMKELRKNFRLVRKNRKLDIPYNGYPNGRDAQAGSFNPGHAFTASAMAYNEDDQDRDGVESILGSMITCVSEQGRRIMLQDIFAALKKCPPKNKPPFDWPDRLFNVNTDAKKANDKQRKKLLKALKEFKFNAAS